MDTSKQVDVCVVGGGPAGMLLGLLLAKQGLETLVLEQHHNFEREYRGEVLMPRFAQLFSQLGLLDYVESFPHRKLDSLGVFAQDKLMIQVDFEEVYPPHPYAVWMPQPILLNALLEKAQAFPNFEMWFGASADQLIQEHGKTMGVRVKRGGEPIEIRAKVTVGADGRTSRIHRLGKFENSRESHDFDVIWFAFPQPNDYGARAGFHICHNSRAYLILPKYPNLLQCGVLTRPGEFSAIREQGVPAMKRLLLEGPAMVRSFAEQLEDFKVFFPLQAKIAYTKEWAQDGLLLIGDAAHTCSPVGAIGVSVAVTTAAVAAEVLVKALKNNDVSKAALSEVQTRRAKDVQHVQALQSRISRLILDQSTHFLPLLPYVAKLGKALGIAQQVPRGLVVDRCPVQLSESLKFSDFTPAPVQL